MDTETVYVVYGESAEGERDWLASFSLSAPPPAFIKWATTKYPAVVVREDTYIPEQGDYLGRETRYPEGA